MKKISEKSFALGYEMAQNRYSKLDTRPKTSEEWVGFFHGVIQDSSNLEWNCGAAAFVTSEEAKNLNVGLLNKELSSLQKASKQYCHDSRMVDRLLPYPDYLDEQQRNVVCRGFGRICPTIAWSVETYFQRCFR